MFRVRSWSRNGNLSGFCLLAPALSDFKRRVLEMIDFSLCLYSKLRRRHRFTFFFSRFVSGAEIAKSTRSVFRNYASIAANVSALGKVQGANKFNIFSTKT